MQAAQSEQAEPARREEAAAEAAGAASACDDEKEYEEEEEEEEGSEDSDSEADRREFGIYQALPVEAGEPDWDAECLDVQEYLRRVRWAATPSGDGGDGGGGGRVFAAMFALPSLPDAGLPLSASQQSTLSQV